MNHEILPTRFELNDQLEEPNPTTKTEYPTRIKGGISVLSENSGPL